MDEVHRLIETKDIRFLLTGSCARKLKRGRANMLAGRVWTLALFPLTFNEIINSKEEIQAEASLRNLPAFSRFLKVAAISNTEMIKYSSISSDA